MTPTTPTPTGGTKPVFIPLQTSPFRRFESGVKRIEWRVFGPRWNHRCVQKGRAVTLSHGYSGARLYGVVARVRRVPRHRAPGAVCEQFPDAKFFCAIHVEVRS